MDFAPLAVAAAMVYTAASLVKALRAGQVSDVLSFVVIFGIAVGVTFLLRASDFAAGIDVGGQALATLNPASTVLLSFGVVSLSKVGYEAKKAVDQSDSAKEPPLIPPTAG